MFGVMHADGTMLITGWNWAEVLGVLTRHRNSKLVLMQTMPQWFSKGQYDQG